MHFTNKQRVAKTSEINDRANGLLLTESYVVPHICKKAYNSYGVGDMANVAVSETFNTFTGKETTSLHLIVIGLFADNEYIPVELDDIIDNFI